jgi:drug/metabolite transporter (DMT)-like permease
VLTAFVFYFLVVFVGTAGEMCMSRAMKSMGEVTDFRPHQIARIIGRAMRLPWFWIGLPMMATGFFALLGMLSIANVSFVYPATALNYVVGAVGGKVFLGESVTPQRWFGVALVCIGVVLVLLSVKS